MTESESAAQRGKLRSNMVFQRNDDEYQIHHSPKSADRTSANRGIRVRRGLNALETEVVLQTGVAAESAIHQTKLSMPKKKSSILGASSNLVNSIVGAGIIGIPYALRMSGLWAGVLLLILVAALTDKSLRLLIEQASFHPRLSHLQVRTFEGLASCPFGKAGSAFVLFNMFIMAYGTMVAYLLIIKDIAQTALGYDHGTHVTERNLAMIATSLAIMLPLSMQRDIASLACTSAFSVVADIVLVVFIAAFSPIRATVAANGGFGEVLKNDGINPTLFIGLGILSMAMACQHSAFNVANSLDNKTRRRWGRITNQSIAISALLCLVLGVCGYLGFLENTQGDVLNSFPHDSMQANVARLLLAFTTFLSYPMESFVARHVLVMLMHPGDMDGTGGFTVENDDRLEAEELGEGDGVDDDAASSGRNVIIEGGGVLCMNRRQIWTGLVYLMTLTPALIFDDIGPVLSLTGAIGGSCISYIGPGLVYLGVNGEEFLQMVGCWLHRWRRARGYTTSNTDADLPTEGNVSLKITHDDGLVSYEIITKGRKPLLYYLGLFPLWTFVAHRGATHMQVKTNAANAVSGGGAAVDVSNVLPSATKFDFAVCFFFIVFGVVSMIAGVISNVYVQVYNLDEVP
ncbi:hypothetical protein ACHAXA_000014 [Cyclostephanos tholiformis]|uniref:Amino acid transporter transmembrane domain-containing protein n=1 Tax=Cyclostephanos tholiformis TaxID=382380 RepID=A0ABD3SR87_9STRA